jgi:hypothetical protein
MVSAGTVHGVVQYLVITVGVHVALALAMQLQSMYQGLLAPQYKSHKIVGTPRAGKKAAPDANVKVWTMRLLIAIDSWAWHKR